MCGGLSVEFFNQDKQFISLQPLFVVCWLYVYTIEPYETDRRFQSII
jgi:hypothetical protein